MSSADRDGVGNRTHTASTIVDMTKRVIDRIAELADQLRGRAEEAEKIGKLTDDTVKSMKEIGNIRLLQSKKHGGLEVHPREFAETVMATAALDPPQGGSTAWSVCTLPDRLRRSPCGR